MPRAFFAKNGALDTLLPSFFPKTGTIEEMQGGGPMNLPGKDKHRVLQLPTGSIRPNPMQPRKSFDEEGLRELA